MRITTILIAGVVVLSSVVGFVGTGLAAEGTAAATASTDPSYYRPTTTSEEQLAVPVALDSAPAGLARGAANAGGGGASAAATCGLDGYGDVRFFLALDTVQNAYYFKPFECRGVGENAEVWVAQDLGWPEGDSRETPVVTDEQVAYMLEEFDSNIYPVESEFFGSAAPRLGNESILEAVEAVPEDYYDTGADRTVILVDNVRDDGYYDEEYPLYIAGFYSSAIQQYSDRNIVTVDAFDWAHRAGGEDAPWHPKGESVIPHLVEGVFAHEYQHLIQGDVDPDETTWANEGFSDLAEYLVGYGHPQGHVNAFLETPDNSLVEWEDQGSLNVLADYGHTYLFHLYLYEQYGPEFVEDLARHPANGAEAVETVLAEYDPDEDFYGLYQDFSTAVAVDGMRTEDSRYRFESIDLEANLTVHEFGADEVGAYGSAYHIITPRGEGPVSGLTVNGIDLLPTEWSVADDPVDGEPALWGGAGTLDDNWAIVEADLTGVSGANLTFETLYDIEDSWDYGVVQVSTDGGETWTSLSNAHTRSDLASGAHPDIAANVPGFTGVSDGWVTEEFDLSAYDGQTVLIAFRSMTDWASNGNGALTPSGWYVRNIDVAGTTYDGSSTEPFMSLAEVRQDFVDYQFTVIGVAGSGRYEVLQYDARTFDSGDAQELAEFFEGDDAGRGPAFDQVIFTVTYAPAPGQTGAVPYEVGVNYYEAGPHKAPGQPGSSAAGEKAEK